MNDNILVGGVKRDFLLGHSIGSISICHPELDSGSTIWLTVRLYEPWIPCQARNDEVLLWSWGTL